MRRALVTVAFLLVGPAIASAQEPLTVYSSLPHVGVDKAASDDVVRAAQMALDDHGGRAGGHPIVLRSLDDGWQLGARGRRRTAANARTAASDPSAIAYIGEFNSGASAISIPITNEAGLLQVSPSNSSVGLTRALRHVSQPGEPDRYIPTGRRNFGRVAPTDALQADALGRYVVELGVRRVALVDDAEIYGSGIAHLLAQRLPGLGVTVVRRERLDKGRRGAAAVRRRLRGARADAMVFAGVAQNGAARLWRAVARRHPRWKLLGPDGIALPSFARAVPRRAARRTYLTALPLTPSAYPPSGQAFFARFRERYGAEPDPYAIFGYEAMAVTLDSIDRSANPASRLAVLRAFFATSDRESPVGVYSIDAFGDTTLGTFGGYRIDASGGIVWNRVLDVAG